MCRAGVGTLSAHEMTTGGVSDRQISPIKGQIVIYRPSIGPNSLREALRATFVGNHPESSGKSRLSPLTTPNRMSEASSLDASPAFNFSGGVLFDRENRTFRQELNTVGDAAAQSRFDVA